jgi:predicted small metal-binding protein
MRALSYIEILSEAQMLIRYSCKDMGLKCTFMVKGDTVEEVTKQALEHVRAVHGADFNSLQTPAEIERMEKSLARSTRIVDS